MRTVVDELEYSDEIYFHCTNCRTSMLLKREMYDIHTCRWCHETRYDDCYGLFRRRYAREKGMFPALPTIKEYP